MVDLLPAQQRVDEEHWYRGTGDAVYQNIDIIQSSKPEYVVILAGDHVYKMDYSIMLQDHAMSGAQVTVGCIEVPRSEASAFGVMSIDASRKIVEFIEKPADPPAMPGNEQMSLASMGIYIFNASALYRMLGEDMADVGSSHDFGKDIIPKAVREGLAHAHPFSMSCVQGGQQSQPYWRDVGTLDAFWAANLDLASVTPELNLYDTEWPIWTSQRQLPPAKFVQDHNGSHGKTINMMVSGGCILSGSSVSNSVLFSNVRVHSFCTINECVLLPDVLVNRSCRLNKVILDRGCVLPEGMVIGEDPVLDAKRFERTSNGVVLVTKKMLRALGETELNEEDDD
jgi:glucose-1-phosphate adenylyltransferase